MGRSKRKTEGEWEDLCDFLDEKEFYIEDMLACVCANLCRNEVKEYQTRIMIDGEIYEITIEKRGYIQ